MPHLSKPYTLNNSCVLCVFPLLFSSFFFRVKRGKQKRASLSLFSAITMRQTAPF